MSVKKAFDTFGKRVQQQARANLTRNKNKASGKLYEDTSYNITVSPRSFSLRFNLSDNEYWQFQDSGVSGTERKFNTPFSYKTEKPPAQIFEKWAKLKGIKPRDKKGKFTSYKSFGFAVAASIFKRGIKPTKFFTKPFENEFKKLPEEVIKAFALELDDLLKFTTS
jgi:hypothetical protein